MLTYLVNKLDRLAPAVEELAVILLKLVEDFQQVLALQLLDLLLRQLGEVFRLLAVGNFAE